MLMAHSWLELETTILVGRLIAGDADGALVEANPFLRAACALFPSCEADAPRSRLAALIAAYLAMVFLDKAVYYTQVFVHHTECDESNYGMQLMTVRKLLSLDQSFMDRNTIAEVRACMNVEAINNMISWNVPYLLTRAVTAVATAAYLCAISWRAAAGAAAGAAAMLALLQPLRRREQAVRSVERALRVSRDHLLEDLLGMLPSIKLFSREALVASQYDDAQRRCKENVRYVATTRALRGVVQGTASGVVVAAALWQLLAGGAEQEDVGTKEVAATLMLLDRLQKAIGSMQTHWGIMEREFPDIERFLSFMQQVPNVSSGKERPPIADGGVKLRDVRFAYPARPGEAVLRGLSLDIQPRKVTAVVGASGSGKSTITKLIMRLYDPCGGAVTIDGHDLRGMALEHLHRHVAIVNQNPDLFAQSIAENIAYGAPGEDCTAERIWWAAGLANCTSFIEELRSGLDFNCGHRGSALSGGERQRLAIARAAMRDPALLILDEATSSLDAENERLVNEALARLMRGRTTLVIAHRLSTIKGADLIVCLKDGAVAEQGTHAELMDRRGVYHDLVNAQVFEDG